VWISHTLQYAMSGSFSTGSSSSGGTYTPPSQQTTPSTGDGNQGFVQVPGGDGH
jgi:hypothetical protein